jgi:hypothetical protein
MEKFKSKKNNVIFVCRGDKGNVISTYVIDKLIMGWI